MKARKAARQKERERAKEREKRQQAASMLREYQKKKKLEAELAKLQERAERKYRERRKVTSEDLLHLWERDKIFLQQRKDLCMREELERREVDRGRRRSPPPFRCTPRGIRGDSPVDDVPNSQGPHQGTPRTATTGELHQERTHLAVPAWRSNLPRGLG